MTGAEAWSHGAADVDERAVLRERACDIRDRYWGRAVSYSRKVFIPLTTMCRNTCGYCTFVKHPDQPGANFMTPDQILAVAAEGERLGCKEALFSLGERPERRYVEARQALARLGHVSTVDYLVEACKLVLANTSLVPHVNAGTLSREEVMRLREVCGSMGMMLENVSRRLTKPGMAHHACPDKAPLIRLRTIEVAGELGVPFTTGILIGIGETWQERIDSLLAINELHARFGHVQEVIVQNFRAKPGTAMADWQEPSRDDMLKTLAVARVALDPSISLQAPPNLEQSFEDYLDCGINDWGGISPVTADHINPERAWPAVAELARRTERCGYRLVERLTVYPAHLETAPLHHRLAGLARADGLVRDQLVT
ncbi:7,8-didemethyl-8-hydroxy-5-deazariboflavin synthase CofG [Mesorhizobium sp. SP-1A]|uniref:7,8-didemethyl-8-hydroxy-5-deazariboflavin synthase CofG n=1 Tax=Mesorhizobium sp. SP-1A TaxID=3077840 RepID=UPI0028F6F082|nr:7,8-didemethyl-8-hydroxy-5-deazariboflavin synthase CofG [Mesorhizobium sp. SP-1A]